MKKRTTELINRALGEEAEKENRVKKTFTTGKDILKECEELEHIIERDGEAAFMEAVKRKLRGRKGDGGVSEEPAGDNSQAEPNTEA